MSKRPPRQAKAERETRDAPRSPLAKLAESENTAPALRELAAAAAWKRLSMGELARRLNDRGYTIDPSNVRRYFESKSPRPDTVELLRSVIGLSDRHIRLASGERLREHEYRAIERSLRLRLATNEATFEEGAVAKALTAYEQLDAERRAYILNAYELQCQRVGAIMVPLASHDVVFDENDPLVAFAKALQHLVGFDMLTGARRASPNEDALWNLWVNLTLPWSPFTERDAEAIVATGVGLLRGRGIATEAMEKRLRREQLALRRAKALAKQQQEKT